MLQLLKRVGGTIVKGGMGMLLLILVTALGFIAAIPFWFLAFVCTVPVSFLVVYSDFYWSDDWIPWANTAVAAFACLPFLALIGRNLLPVILKLEDVVGKPELPSIGEEFGTCVNDRLDIIRNWRSGGRYLMWLLSSWVIFVAVMSPSIYGLDYVVDGSPVFLLAVFPNFVVTLYVLGLVQGVVFRCVLSRRDIAEAFVKKTTKIELPPPPGKIRVKPRKKGKIVF